MKPDKKIMHWEKGNNKETTLLEITKDSKGNLSYETCNDMKDIILLAGLLRVLTKIIENDVIKFITEDDDFKIPTLKEAKYIG